MVREHGEHKHTQANTARKSESDIEHSSHRHTQTITERAETQRAETQRDAHRETHTERRAQRPVAKRRTRKQLHTNLQESSSLIPDSSAHFADMSSKKTERSDSRYFP